MSGAPREESRAGAESPRAAAEPGAEARQRARLRRFGLALAAVVLLLALFAVGYVVLFDRVLADPGLPPTPASRANPRVLIFELLLAAALAVGATAWLVRRQRSKR